MAIKLARSQNVQWHWQHLLREFGLGRYANADLLLPRGNCRPTFLSR
jgi:hypothetical protein